VWGSLVNACDDHGMTVLTYAVSMGVAGDVVSKVCTAMPGLDPHKPDQRHHLTPVELARAMNRYDIAQILLHHLSYYKL